MLEEPTLENSKVRMFRPLSWKYITQVSSGLGFSPSVLLGKSWQILGNLRLYFVSQGYETRNNWIPRGKSGVLFPGYFPSLWIVSRRSLKKQAKKR